MHVGCTLSSTIPHSSFALIISSFADFFTKPLLGEYPSRKPHNIEQDEVKFASLNFQVETGSRYVGSFIGEAKERDSWIVDQVDDWMFQMQHVQCLPTERIPKPW